MKIYISLRKKGFLKEKGYPIMYQTLNTEVKVAMISLLSGQLCSRTVERQNFYHKIILEPSS